MQPRARPSTRARWRATPCPAAAPPPRRAHRPSSGSAPRRRPAPQRRLVGLKAAVAKEDPAHARQLAQLGREFFLQRRTVVVRGVNQPADLFLQCGNQFRVRMAQGVDRNAAQTVEVLLAVGVPHPAALPMRHRHGKPAIGVHDVGFGVDADELRSVHVGSSGVLRAGSGRRFQRAEESNEILRRHL